MRTRTDLIIIHCSATPPSLDATAKDIDRWHRQKGWLKIGYHFVIRRNGVLEVGRGLDEVGAHASGHNSNSVGVCLVGGTDANMNPEDNFTQAQWDTLWHLLLKLKGQYPKAKVIGHNEVSAKACPSFDVQQWLKGREVKTGEKI